MASLPRAEIRLNEIAADETSKDTTEALLTLTISEVIVGTFSKAQGTDTAVIVQSATGDTLVCTFFNGIAINITNIEALIAFLKEGLELIQFVDV